jgi:hypothetical protein
LIFTIRIVLILFLFACCAEKTVSLADGRIVTQRKYDRMIQHAFKTADKEARKAVKGKMSRRQIREFKNSKDIPVDVKINQD